ncbi:alkaline phosphatase [Malassezia obtusa]|uniref:Alkaline phosphatase n=1 Tax=Malassezia obtusa TaxID=76774 RepID=A0AAF0E1V9_9BASI|nr:alkaline phosphatase [Malassezia obtusa]
MIAKAFLTLALVVCLVIGADAKQGKRSVIQLIADGFGPASETFAREFMQARNNVSWGTELVLDRHLVGSIRTRAVNTLVTDSAASATAYSCGVKSKNAYIGVDIDQKPCGTVLEAAKQAGLNTALVTTTRVTHATPASYSSHISDRDLENDIAVQQIGEYSLGRQLDLLWGGGRRHFLPKSSKDSKREDDRNLIEEAQNAGWTVALNRDDFDEFENGDNVKFPSLALFTNSHMSYEVDREQKKEPSLTEMTIAALNSLAKQDKPFFIMVEGGRVDHAGHNNDPIGHVYDILEYNRMFEAVAKWVDEHDKSSEGGDEYLVLSTADHECGGLTLADQRPEDEDGEYAWFPDQLFGAKHSTEYLSAMFLEESKNMTSSEKLKYMKETIVEENLGMHNVTDAEIKRAVELSRADDDGLALTIWLASIVNWRAHIGWTTTGHSGVDVNLYLHTKNQTEGFLRNFRANHENTWISKFTASFLDLDLQSVTDRLNNGSHYVAGHTSSNNSVPYDPYHAGPNRVVPSRLNLYQMSKRSKRSNKVYYSHVENTMHRRTLLG